MIREKTGNHSKIATSKKETTRILVENILTILNHTFDVVDFEEMKDGAEVAQARVANFLVVNFTHIFIFIIL